MLNKFRHVEGDSDGHIEWQCLKCREKFSAPMLYGWKFCPLCGTQWEGELKWEKPFYQMKHMKNPYTWVIQERSVYTHAEGDRITEWKDSCKRMEAWMYGRWVKAKDVLDWYKNEIHLIQADLASEEKMHKRYCERMGTSDPFSPFAVYQIRLVVRKEGVADRTILEYLPGVEVGKTSMAWMEED